MSEALSTVAGVPASHVEMRISAAVTGPITMINVEARFAPAPWLHTYAAQMRSRLTQVGIIRAVEPLFNSYAVEAITEPTLLMVERPRAPSPSFPPPSSPPPPPSSPPPASLAPIQLSSGGQALSTQTASPSAVDDAQEAEAANPGHFVAIVMLGLTACILIVAILYLGYVVRRLMKVNHLALRRLPSKQRNVPFDPYRDPFALPTSGNAALRHMPTEDDSFNPFRDRTTSSPKSPKSPKMSKSSLMAKSGGGVRRAGVNLEDLGAGVLPMEVIEGMTASDHSDDTAPYVTQVAIPPVEAPAAAPAASYPAHPPPLGTTISEMSDAAGIVGPVMRV